MFRGCASRLLIFDPAKLGDTLPKALNIKDFFQDLLVFIQQFLTLSRRRYYTNAKYLVFAYIQHTIGQYAYVYKNFDARKQMTLMLRIKT